MGSLRKVPRRLSLRQIDEEVQKFFRGNKRYNKVPVPIEEIVCKYYGYDILPVTNLYEELGMTGFPVPHKKEIYIDKAIFENTSPNRFNSTLAHEVGHLVLHREFISKFNDENEVESFLTSFENDPEDLAWLEKQAWTYARYLLLPTHHFNRKLTDLIEEKRMSNFSIRDISALLKIPIARYFEVADEMTKIRIQMYLENGI